jgi:hypothetical protein
MSDKIPGCDEIDIEICSIHPHNEQPCDGNCGDTYLRLTIKDWRGDILKAEGKMESLRGGILLDEEGQAKIKALHDKLKD